MVSALDGTNGAKLPTLEGLDAFMKAMEAEYKGNMAAARTAALALEKVADAAVKKFKANPKIPKTSVEYGNKVSTNAGTLATDLQDAVTEPLKTVRTARANLAKYQEGNAKVHESDIPALKKDIVAKKFPYIESHPKIMAAFRKYCVAGHLDEQLDAYEASKLNATGEKAVELYLEFIKVGSPKEANVSNEIRKDFDAKYAKYMAAKASKTGDPASFMVDLKWQTVGQNCIGMMAQRIAEFATSLEKYYP